MPFPTEGIRSTGICRWGSYLRLARLVGGKGSRRCSIVGIPAVGCRFVIDCLIPNEDGVGPCQAKDDAVRSLVRDTGHRVARDCERI